MVASKIVLRIVIFVFSFVPTLTSELVHYGLLSAENVSDASKTSAFCITYNPRFHDIPKSKDEAKAFNLVNLTGSEYEYFCRMPSVRLPLLNGSAVAVLRGNCTFSEKAVLVQSLGGRAVLIVSPYELHEPVANSTYDYNQTQIIVAMILDADFRKMKDLGVNLSVKFYAPDLPSFDVNLVLIWLTAVATVILGSYWSGTIRHQLWLHKLGLLPVNAPQWRFSEEESKTDVQYSAKVIIVIVILMCAMLLGLYFLYDYLIYVIVVLFGLASSAALYDCLWMVMVVVLPPFATCRIPSNRIYWLRTRPEVRELVLMLSCLAVGIWWIVERHKSYAWILQDILGVAFCMQMMKKIRLPSLKICSVLLLLLFVYDIFFVFITPLFTKDGSSVMVDIATGRGSSSGEKIPIVLMFPKITAGEFSACFWPYSLLGFGDVLVPGLLVSFCYGFDLQSSSKGIYFASTAIAYGVGLVLTFAALAIMKQGQPALLYLVPCTLTTVVILALARKEFGQMWSGQPKLRKDSPAASDDVSLSKSGLSPVRRSPAAATDETSMDYSSAGEEDHMLGQK